MDHINFFFWWQKEKLILIHPWWILEARVSGYGEHSPTCLLPNCIHSYGQFTNLHYCCPACHWDCTVKP